MPGLFTALATSANTLNVYEQVFQSISDNVENANTPGYAKQQMSPVPMAFDPAAGLSGGIAPGKLESSRNEYAERAVQDDNSAWGYSDELSSQLSGIQPLFDVTGTSGLPNALDQFFQSFSALSITPNDAVARSTVLNQADQLAQEFNGMATGLANASTALNSALQNATDTVNNLAADIAAINRQIQHNGGQANTATDAALHNDLESLSEYVGFNALKQSDGTVMVLMGNQTPVVIGDQSYAISAQPDDTGAVVIEDSNGDDVTSQLSGGRLSALADMKNTELPELSGQLNQLATGVADAVNNVLAAGVDQNGDPGTPMFSYDTSNDAAFSIQFTGMTTDELAAATADAPGGNSNALALNQLGATPQINGLTFMQFYGQLAGQVGSHLETAQTDASTQQDLLTQARSMRSEISSVSLDEEAAELIQYQNAYEATAKIVTTLDSLTQTTIQMLQ
jgi:flagellar hook-associated protein 1